MVRVTVASIALLVSIAGGAALNGNQSTAAAAKGKISPAPDRGGENQRAARRLAKAIATNPRYVRRASFSAIPPFGDPAGISTKRLAGFPLHGHSFGILANGDVKDADNPNDSGANWGELGGPSIRGARDVVIMRTVLRVPQSRSCLSIRFRFLSEEFPEFVNDMFNDAFIAELDESNWDASSKTDPVIKAPGNFATDSQGHPIRINSVGDTTMKARYAKGTTYDGATRILRASTPVSPGRHILYLSIFDQGDRGYDSAVFLDRLTIDNRKPCKPGAVKGP